MTIGDIGTVEDSYVEPRNLARLDGQPAVTLVVRKQTGTNTVEVIDTVKKRLETLQGGAAVRHPDAVIRDQSRFIQRSIDEVKFHLVLAGMLVSLTVMLFIANLRATLICAVAIPTSIIATFTVMRWLGFTLNNVTMLALVLATGIVIDDAVVVLENIFRYMEEKGVTARQAASEATGEISLAVMATTLLAGGHLPAGRVHGRARSAASSTATASPSPSRSWCRWWCRSRSRRCCARATCKIDAARARRAQGVYARHRSRLRRAAALVAAPPLGRSCCCRCW